MKWKNKISYVCVDDLKIISKLSVLKPINEFDYLSNLKCSLEIMKKIDEAIINEYIIFLIKIIKFLYDKCVLGMEFNQ